jgi:SpoIID/LytB domain protein
VVLVSLCAAGVLASPEAASAYPSSGVALTGHGFGHGHGMGQWGALGYALADTGYQSILGHYYGGTSAATLPAGQDSHQVRVALTENDGNTVIVTSGSPFSVGGTSIAVPAGQAVLMGPVGGGVWTVSTGPGCGGPWTARATLADPTAQPSSNPVLGDPQTAAKALQLCQIGGNLTTRGSIEATYNSAGAPRTVNTLPLEQYVAGVVPNESPAGWAGLGGPGPQGQPWGFQELEAQAVAARSFVMAGLGSYGGYADICDLACQAYRGVENETAASDLAVTDTAAGVREFAGGAVASTQYSASTGGYTAPGAFPAVVDAGDSVCVTGACNPDHSWSASVPVSTVEAVWPQLGTLEAVDVTARNGLGDWGGRVTAMTLVGSRANVSLSGGAFAGALGIKSDWFTVGTTITGPAVGMAPTPDGRGYWVVGANGSLFAFGDAAFEGSADGLVLNKPVVGMAATADGKGYWLVASDGGIFSYGDARFYGSTGDLVLNKPVVGMAATPDGKGYWLVAADGGVFSYGDAGFYGSTGSLVLNEPVVGMSPTHDGKGYWLVASDGGVFAFGDATFEGSMGGQPLNRPVVGMSTIPTGDGYRLVAADGGVFDFGRALFYGSTGSLHLVRPVVGMAGTADGRGYWMVAADGGIFSFGDADFFGSAAG